MHNKQTIYMYHLQITHICNLEPHRFHYQSHKEIILFIISMRVLANSFGTGFNQSFYFCVRNLDDNTRSAAVQALLTLCRAHSICYLFDRDRKNIPYMGVIIKGFDWDLSVPLTRSSTQWLENMT